MLTICFTSQFVNFQTVHIQVFAKTLNNNSYKEQKTRFTDVRGKHNGLRSNMLTIRSNLITNNKTQQEFKLRGKSRLAREGSQGCLLVFLFMCMFNCQFSIAQNINLMYNACLELLNISTTFVLNWKPYSIVLMTYYD